MAVSALAWVFRNSLHGLRDDVAGFGYWGVVLYVGVFAIWSLSTVPAIPLMAVSGLVFGVWEGTLWSLVGAILGTTWTFWIGRATAKGAIQRWRRRHETVAKTMQWVRLTLNRAGRDRRIVTSPANGIQMPTPRRSDMRLLDPNQVELLAEALPDR